MSPLYAPSFLLLPAGSNGRIQECDFKFRVRLEVLPVIEGTRRNSRTNSAARLAAFCAVELVADSHDNAAALNVPPVRSEDVERH